MSFVTIWVHIVFATKNRYPFLIQPLRDNLLSHIRENCKQKEIFLQAVNGYTDHLHCLVSLDKEQPVAKLAQLIKGESAFWINKNKLTSKKFEWQDDYYAVSVSMSQMQTVMRYIAKQEQHHSKKTFAEELDVFNSKHRWN